MDKKKIDIAELRAALNAPVGSNVSGFVSVDEIRLKSAKDCRRFFGLPASLGMSKEEREKLNDGFAWDTIYESLTEHAILEGQYPLSSFIGYGVLQQIAQNGMIRTCIQTVSDDIFRDWIELQGGKGDSDKRLEQLSDMLDQRKIKELFTKAANKTGYYGGCFIYIDTGTEDPSLPLVVSNKSAEIKKDSKIKLVLIDPVNVTPLQYNSIDPLRDDYMIPQMWSVLGKSVHASRMIIFTDNEPPVLLKPAYNFLGIPQAQILWDYVLHWNKARTNAVQILDKLNLTVYKTNASELLATPDGIQLLDLRMKSLQRYRNNSSVLVCDNENESVENITQVISGAVDVVRQALEFVASINRTPAVKLLGISPSGFNATGESDIKNYYDHLRTKQELYREQLKKVLDVFQLVLFGEIDPEITFEFNEIAVDERAQNASTFKQQVDSLIALQGAGVIDNAEIREYVRTSDISGLDFISEEVPERNADPETMQIMSGAINPQMPGQEIEEQGKGTEEWQKNLLS